MRLRTSITEAMTRRINARGILIDQAHCREQIALVNQAKADILAELRTLTGLDNPASPQQLRPWLEDRGCYVPDMQKATVQDALTLARIKAEKAEASCDAYADMEMHTDEYYEVAQILDDEETTVRVLELRLFVQRSPTAKYEAVMRKVSADGRLRGMLMYCGASKTGRWSSPGFQNMPRPVREDDLLPEGTPERVIQNAINSIRKMIIPEEGKQLVVSDLTGVEAMLAAWLAGEVWVLDVFRDPEGDIYKSTYSGTTGVPVDRVTAHERLTGKVESLALGFLGGLGAFLQFAANLGLDLTKLYDVVWHVAPQHHKSAEYMWDYHHHHSPDMMAKMKRKYGSKTKEVVLACEVIKYGWREANSRIVQFGKDLEFAWIAAIATPGTIHTAGRIAMSYGKIGTGPALRMTLPSGRHIYHHWARATSGADIALAAIKKARASKRTTALQTKLLDGLEQVLPGACVMDDIEIAAALDDATVQALGKAADRRFSTELSYMSLGKNQKWMRLSTYSGSLIQTCSEGIGKDLLSYNLPEVEKAGYKTILLVHDEVVTEAPLDKTHEELSRLITRLPKWAGDMPLSADGYQTTEGYRK